MKSLKCFSPNFVQDTSDVFQLSGSHLEKSPVHFDNKLVGNQNPVDSKSDTSFCENNTCECQRSFN